MAGLPLSATAWRSLAYVVVGAPWGLLSLAVLLVLVAAGLALTPVGIGLALLAGVPVVAGAFATIERARARWIGAHDVATSPPRPAVGRRRIGDPAVWREIAFTAVTGVLLAPAGAVVTALLGVGLLLVVSPVVVVLVAPEPVNLLPDRPADGPVDALPFAAAGVVAVVLCLYLATGLASVHAVLVRQLLYSREDDLDARVDELTVSRARLADAFEADRRRIERDLHDGTQQHLGAVLMTLGQLDHELGRDATRAAALVSRARDQAVTAQQRLRTTIRGIHPPVLTDHGLPAALDEVAVGHDPPVELDAGVTDLGRLPAPVESCAYFVVLEALANTARHADATLVRIRAGVDGGALRIVVADDGRGGADPAEGTGLRGLVERVAVLGGTLSVTSPPGAGTTVEAVIPCRG